MKTSSFSLRVMRRVSDRLFVKRFRQWLIVSSRERNLADRDSAFHRLADQPGDHRGFAILADLALGKARLLRLLEASTRSASI